MDANLIALTAGVLLISYLLLKDSSL